MRSSPEYDKHGESKNYFLPEFRDSKYVCKGC